MDMVGRSKHYQIIRVLLPGMPKKFGQLRRSSCSRQASRPEYVLLSMLSEINYRALKALRYSFRLRLAEAGFGGQVRESGFANTPRSEKFDSSSFIPGVKPRGILADE
jgi:hypothetical protein